MLSWNTAITLMQFNFPGFQDTLNEYWAKEGDNERVLGYEMMLFCDYALDLIEEGQTQDLPRIFDFIEILLRQGDEDTQTIAATCFIESFVSLGARGRIPEESFMPLLGTESRNHAIGWNEFISGKDTEIYKVIDEIKKAN
jgi:hypothetical protein